MSEDENIAPIEAPAWESTRTIWSAGGVDLPETMKSNNAHFLADLKGAAANFSSANTVPDVDRGLDWSFDELADRCGIFLIPLPYRHCCLLTNYRCFARFVHIAGG